MLDNKNFFSEDVTRREFIKQGILGLMGTGIALSGLDMLFGKDVFAAFDADPAEKIGRMYFRKLGKTGLKISEIGMNGGILKDPSVLSFAMDAGLNYIETGPEYSQGEAERTLGKVLKLRREEIIVATKWKVFEEYRVKELETSLNDSLKRLNTDFVDIIQVWGTRRKTQVNHEPIFEAFQKLKEQGKVRHLGITVHMNVVELCDEIIANGQYEQMTVAYHYDNHEEIDPVLIKAAQNDIGFVAQFIDSGMEKISGPHKGTSRGVLEWMLKNKYLTSAIDYMNTIAEVDELLQVPRIIRQ